MKDVFLKIMKNTEYPAKTRDELATEIADIVKAFEEWKHSRNSPICNFVFKTKKFILNGKRRHYTVNDLFNFWYNEIREK